MAEGNRKIHAAVSELMAEYDGDGGPALSPVEAAKWGSCIRTVFRSLGYARNSGYEDGRWRGDGE